MNENEYQTGSYIVNKSTGERISIKKMISDLQQKSERAPNEHYWMDPEEVSAAYEEYSLELRNGTLGSLSSAI